MPTIPTSEEARVYEFCVLYPYPLSQKEEQDLMKEVEGVFDEVGAKQVSKDVWGRRGLAYRIKGHEEGVFVIYHYDMDPAKVAEVDSALRIMRGLVRHMVVKPPKGYEIVKFSENYEEWLKTRKEQEEAKEREREAALARKVAERAKRKVKKVEVEKKEVEKQAAEKPTVKKEEIQEELEKLISDDDLDL